MNSAEEISRYKENPDSYYSPTLSKRLLGYGYDLPEKSPKKDKKWSIGSLFRRKKKEESDTSSEEDSQKKGFLGRKKKKPEKKKKILKSVGTFDHVVLSRNSHLYSNGLNGHEDSAIFSDPSGGFNGYTGRSATKTTQTQEPTKKYMKNIRDSVEDVNNSRASLSSATPDSVIKKSRRVLTKARAEARRVNLKHDTSSDEDSQRSASSFRFRSDESLGQLHREGSVNRRSRAARTERYLKRHSKDGENPKDYLRLSKSDAENCGLQWKTSDDSNRSPSRSPLASATKNKPKTSYSSISQSPSISGLSTIPPSHGSYSRIRVSNSTSNPSYKPPLSMNDYNNYSARKLPNDYFDNHRSLSCDANIHKSPSTEIEPEVMHVQFPLGKPNNRLRNLSLIESRHVNAALSREPPPPPPRDPRRLVTAQYYENVRPTTYYFDSTGQTKSQSFSTGSQLNQSQQKKYSSFNLHPNCRSTSEDYLPKSNIQLLPRPSSATPESPVTPGSQRFIQRPSEFKTNTDHFNYLTDKKPRSRKPIFIQTSTIEIDNPMTDKSGTQKALEFWKQKDREGCHSFPERLTIKKTDLKSPLRSPMGNPLKSPLNNSLHSPFHQHPLHSPLNNSLNNPLNNPPNSSLKSPMRSPMRSPMKSPQMFTCQTHVQTQVFLPSVLQNDMNSETLTNSSDSLRVNENIRAMSPFKPISPDERSSVVSINRTSPIIIKSPNHHKINENEEEIKRKSSNLEEALDELEAIYNSLRLGDEDLLERAEQREKDAAAQKLKEKRNELYPNWGVSRGALSDSNFSYEPFDSVDSPRRKRFLKKSQTVDRRADDMAFRKLNKERAATINDPQSLVSKVSYLHASPVYGRDTTNEDVPNKSSKEPDITLDDVVYRNVKFANSSPKVVEPQPPFGIPIGPITPAANSDYLHAVPDNVHRPTFKPRKIPDLVKDDLAFRNLRKDQSKEPALPPLSPDDLKNNNAFEMRLDLSTLKKKRAVRSLSANIGSLINKDASDLKGSEKYKYNNNSENESKTLTDIADAMEIARQVLREKENKISSTKKAFLSDTDTNNGNADNFAESRMNFLNSLKNPSSPRNTYSVPHVSESYLHTKPPRLRTPDRSPRSPKELTPAPVSPTQDKSRKSESRDSSLTDLLTALATEARETNERISNELKPFSHEGKRENSPTHIDENLNKQELNKTLSDIDAVSEQAKLCEKLLEGVVDSTDLMASAKPPMEEVVQINIVPAVAESVANVVLTRDDLKLEKKSADKTPCESDHDYENLVSDTELNLEIVNDEEIKCTSPFEEHKAELIASFQELKNNVDLDIAGPRNVTEIREKETINDNRDTTQPSDPIKDDKENKDTVTGEESVSILDGDALYIKECAYVEPRSNVSNQEIYVSNCDIVVSCSTNNDQTNLSDLDDSSGSHSNSSLGYGTANSLGSLESHVVIGQTHLDSLESLKSPKLVLESSKLSKGDGNKQILENQSMLCRDACTSYPGTSSSETDFRRRNSERGSDNTSEPGHILDDDEKPTPAWYRDPTTLAVACSYGFACAHQLASLDFVAILGILFAVLSFIAALIF